MLIPCEVLVVVDNILEQAALVVLEEVRVLKVVLIVV